MWVVLVGRVGLEGTESKNEGSSDAQLLRATQLVRTAPEYYNSISVGVGPSSSAGAETSGEGPWAMPLESGSEEWGC